jgi:hypothetical protein
MEETPVYFDIRHSTNAVPKGSKSVNGLGLAIIVPLSIKKLVSYKPYS